ncbi:MAG: hypothetical protein IKD10_04025 [Lentisphaeria bacterium]|nr:hypothetical protein [Lentisphaeria bacterium]
MNGMSPDEAFDAMTVKLFGTDDAVFRAALKIALNNGLLRHFDGVKEGAICTRDHYGMNMAGMNVCSGSITILKACKEKVTTDLGKICLDDLLDALWEKELSQQSKFIAQDIFDNGCTADRRQKFADFRKGYADYFDHMIDRWNTYRSTIKPNVFAERKAPVLESLAKLEERLACNAWVKITGTLPDYFGVESITVEYKANGEWVKLASGVYKPAGNAIFCRFVALEKDIAEKIEEVRITGSGLGGVGINYVEIFANGKLYIPQAIIKVAGKVSDPWYLLNNNGTFAWFGGQSTRYDYFDRNAAEQKNSVILAMQEFSADNIAMVQK